MTVIATYRLSTFPTGYTDVAPQYKWWSTSSRTGVVVSQTTVIAKTQITYSATGSSLLSPPASEGTIPWRLVPVYTTLDSSQLSWFVSVYSAQAPLTKCKITTLGAMVTRPPVAVHGVPTQASATEPQKHSQQVSAYTRPLNTLDTIIGSSSQSRPVETHIQGTPTGQKVASTTFGETSAQRGSSLPLTAPIASSSHQIGTESEKSPDKTRTDTSTSKVSSDQASPRSDRASRRPGQHIETVLEKSLAAATTKLGSSPTHQKTLQPVTLENGLALRPMSSGGYALRSGRSLIPGNTATVSGTTYALLSSEAGLLINGETTEVPSSPQSKPGQPDDGLKVSKKSGKIVFEGKTLGMTSTLTVGSGTVITRLALGTNSMGQTILLGDSITLSTSDNLSRFAVPSSEGPAATTPSIPPAQTTVQSSISSSGASKCPRWSTWTLFSAILAVIAMLKR